MTVGKAIFNLLNNSTDLTAIVGTRIYPEVAQQDAPLPYVVYNISNNEPSDTKREPSKMDTANIEVNCYSTSYTQVIDMSVAVRAALDRVTGTYSGVNVQSIAYMNEVIDFDEGQRAYNVSSDYDVRISRTDFEIAQGSPITGVDLGDLADVNTTGVTDGQVIAYDAATAVWLPATDAGGAEQLNDLSDVIISQPAQGEFFRYDGGEWVNDTAQKSDVGLGNVDNTSDANKPVSTATQTALDLKADITSVPTELDDLNDVQIIGTPTLGQALVYGAGKWLPGAAGATDLGDLDDVNTTGAAFGSLLTYNGASWDISGSQLPTDDIYFHQRYETESEALRTGATATTELYFTCTAQGNGLAESASSDTPTAGQIIKRKIYYSDEGFADPDTGTWVEFTPAPADDASFATVKAALLENLKARTGGTVPISLKQTWEEVAEAPTFVGLLNETYGSGAEAAYSTRRLNGNVTECMVIRRASGTPATTTIGFDSNGNIDEAAITTFCTGTTCTVETWKDQSGNGNDATQATPAKQPTIYTGGQLVKEGGRLALDFDGSNDGLLTSGTTLMHESDYTAIFLARTNNVTSTKVFISGGSSGTKEGRVFFHLNDRLTQGFLGASTGSNLQTITANTQNLYYAENTGFHTGETYETKVYIDGGNLATATGTGLTTPTGTSAFGIGFNGHLNTDSLNGKIQETIIYPSVITANRTDIESNVGDYFTQNTPLLDTYSGAAAAYSLRLLDSTYTGALIRVSRSVSDNTEQDINSNVFGELDTVSLLAFAGTGDAFVKVWYCQSGNSNDATQTVTGSQPQIVSSGAVIVENGKPAVDFNVTSNYLETSFNSITAYPLTNVNVTSCRANSDVTMINDSTSATVQFGNSYGQGKNRIMTRNGTLFRDGPTAVFNQQNLNFLYWTDSTTRAIAVNGATPVSVAGTTTFPSIDVLAIGATLDATPAGYYDGLIQEVVWWAVDQDTAGNRTGIETNIATFYDITL